MMFGFNGLWCSKGFGVRLFCSKLGQLECPHCLTSMAAASVFGDSDGNLYELNLKSLHGLETVRPLPVEIGRGGWD